MEGGARALAHDASILATWFVKNELNALVLLNFAASIYALLAYVTTLVFLGGLNSREASRLTERLIRHIVIKMLFISALGASVGNSVPKFIMWISW